MAAAAEDSRRWGRVVCAALALPGVGAPAAEAPTEGRIGFKWLSYQDWQPGLKRVRAESPSLQLQAPLGERWSLVAGATHDSVSGASPRYHSAVSGASRMSDRRRAGDLKITHHDERSSWSAGAAASSEHDFASRALSFEAAGASEDNNRSWNAGLGLTRDRISSSDDAALQRRRRTVELTAGLTQVLSTVDIVQAGLTLAEGQGYYSDPYKRVDQRPESRHQRILLLRWNHHAEAWHGTLRASYRHYRDSFGIRAHTLAAEWVQPMSAVLVLTPSLRVYSQSAAWFYYDPVYSYAGAPLPPGYLSDPPDSLSPDARLSAFGALTLGLKLALRLPEGWHTDIKLEHYEQRGSWRLGGGGSPGLVPLRARFLQFGLSRQF